MRTFNMQARLLLVSLTTMLVLSVTMIGATVVLAAKPIDTVAVDLDQCRNGGLEDPQESFAQCVTTGSARPAGSTATRVRRTRTSPRASRSRTAPG